MSHDRKPGFVPHRGLMRAMRLSVAASIMLGLAIPAASAQSLTRGPNLNIGPRAPSISVGPTFTPRITTINPVLPSVRYSPNLHPMEYDDPPPRRRRIISDVPVRDNPGKPPNASVKKPIKAAKVIVDRSFVPNEVVLEVSNSLTETQVGELARRHRLTRLETQEFPLIGSTLVRWRISDGRSVDAVMRELINGGSVRSAQRNHRFTLQQMAAAGDPAQYALAKLRLPEAHALSRGKDVTIAVIDSAVDVAHAELAGVIANVYDSLGSKEGPHVHGTGIAGAIASHARLMGSAPSARILAIRAFGVAGSGAESTSFVIMKSLEFAVSRGAQIINMSFAGPQDALIARALAAAAEKGIVLVAASGNAGAKSPPLFPAADRNVIAVSAIDSSDKLFAASNRGSHIAIAAPGADILLPAPDGKYQVTSGTSFAAAYISGLAALMIERNPTITPAEIRTILTTTAQDLGPPGRDDQFGAGKADAFSAVSAVALPPVASASDSPSAAAGSSVR